MTRASLLFLALHTNLLTLLIDVSLCISASLNLVLYHAYVPQGSVLGLLLFSFYISPVGRIDGEHNIPHQQFADDTQYFSLLMTARVVFL